MIEIILVIVVIAVVVIFIYLKWKNSDHLVNNDSRNRFISRRQAKEEILIVKNQKDLLINLIKSRFKISKQVDENFYFKNAIITINKSLLRADYGFMRVAILGISIQLVKGIKNIIEKDLQEFESIEFFGLGE
jgi:hypothetical protein